MVMPFLMGNKEFMCIFALSKFILLITMGKIYVFKGEMMSYVILLAALFYCSATADAQLAVDSLTLPTGKLDWIDPIHATPVSTHYVLYPTPSRGDGTLGSCMVYPPKSYDENPDKRFPVIYYLHGGTGNQREARWMIERIDKAINSGKMNPVIVVSPQALPIGWYVNANTADEKVTSGPIHDVIINDLIPYIDTHFRTVSAPEGRGIEGFSMGGRGALMLAFEHPDLFGAVSSVAGAVVNWDEEPLQQSLKCTFGDISSPLAKAYFEAWHPLSFACRNAREIIRKKMGVRMFVGDRYRLYEENGRNITHRFHACLDTLGISHTLEISPGANHNPSEIFAEGVREYDTSFWDTNLHGTSCDTIVNPSFCEELQNDF